ncbi:hypothetical protein AAG570_005722 [Ranatra chinensis]|uniref:Uncharacterized protein n=1 Tax=Ranatra chinensis TaxID=642074 RepID=A0ABD0XY94_9HEMI
MFYENKKQETTEMSLEPAFGSVFGSMECMTIEADQKTVEDSEKLVFRFWDMDVIVGVHYLYMLLGMLFLGYRFGSCCRHGSQPTLVLFGSQLMINELRARDDNSYNSWHLEHSHSTEKTRPK